MVVSRFYADAYLLILWLGDTQDGRFKPALRQLLIEELNGKGGAPAARKILADALDPSIEEKLSVFARESMEKNRLRTARSDAAPRGPPAAAATAAPALKFAGVTSLEQFRSLPKLSPVSASAMRWLRFSSSLIRVKECFSSESPRRRPAAGVGPPRRMIAEAIKSSNEEVRQERQGRIVEAPKRVHRLDRGE
jgi:hypothetical protein